MTATEVAWVSGLFAGLVFAVPLAVVIDLFLLRPVARFVHAVTGYDWRR